MSLCDNILNIKGSLASMVNVMSLFGLKIFHIGFFGLVSLFNGISTFVGYLMPKPFS